MGFIRHSDDRSSNICGFNVIQIEISAVKIRISTRKKRIITDRIPGFEPLKMGLQTTHVCVFWFNRSSLGWNGVPLSRRGPSLQHLMPKYPWRSIAARLAGDCWSSIWIRVPSEFRGGPTNFDLESSAYLSAASWEEDCCEMNLILDCKGLTSNYRSPFAWMSGCWFGGLWNCRMWKVQFWCTMRLFLSNSCEWLQHTARLVQKSGTWYKANPVVNDGIHHVFTIQSA